MHPFALFHEGSPFATTKVSGLEFLGWKTRLLDNEIQTIDTNDNEREEEKTLHQI